MSAASDSDRWFRHMKVLLVAELTTKILLAFYRSWSKPVFVGSHGQGVAFLLDWFVLNHVLIKWRLAVNKWPFRALVCLWSVVALPQRICRSLLLAHSFLVRIVLIDVFDRFVTRAELEGSGTLCSAAIYLPEYVWWANGLFLKTQRTDSSLLLSSHLLRRKMPHRFTLIV